MNHRNRIKRIISGQPVDRCGLWLGKPHTDSLPGLLRYFGCDCEESLRVHLNDDIRWICPQFYSDAYIDPSGRELFDSGLDRHKHSRPPLADCQDIEQVNDFPWPDPKYLDFTSCMADLEKAGDVYRLSGFWTCFYHNMMDLMGMEEYLVKMYTHPHIVEAITDRVCQFYYEANERFFKEAGGLVDGFFYGNDFGTQLSLICCRDHFMRFIMPWFKQFTRQGHRHNLQIVLHSCGSIFEVIDDIIEAGVQCLHPLQALAANMDAETLSKNFKGRIAFLGGIDTQQLLANGTPEMVRREVRRVRELLGPNLIISPSHEAILPDVPPENIEALAIAAVEDAVSKKIAIKGVESVSKLHLLPHLR
jgi:uroporphyrinogen decarboxylase